MSFQSGYLAKIIKKSNIRACCQPCWRATMLNCGASANHTSNNPSKGNLQLRNTKTKSHKYTALKHHKYTWMKSKNMIWLDRGSFPYYQIISGVACKHPAIKRNANPIFFLSLKNFLIVFKKECLKLYKKVTNDFANCFMVLACHTTYNFLIGGICNSMKWKWYNRVFIVSYIFCPWTQFWFQTCPQFSLLRPKSAGPHFNFHFPCEIGSHFQFDFSSWDWSPPN